MCSLSRCPTPKNKYSIFSRRSLFWKIYFSMILALFLPIALFSVHHALTENRRHDEEKAAEMARSLEWGATLLANHAEALPDDSIDEWLRGVETGGEMEIYIGRGGRWFSLPESKWLADFLSGSLIPPPHGPLPIRALSQTGTTEAIVMLVLRPPFPPGGPLIRNVGFIAVAALGLLISFLIVRNYVRPLVELRNVTARLAEGDFSVRAGDDVLSHGEEISGLGTSFNWMAECVENVFNSQKRLLADISHEIRSPLQRMDVALTLARKDAGDDLCQYLDRVELEMDRINEMVGELLTLTRAETIAEAPESVRLDEILRDVAADAEFEGQLEGKTIDAKIESMSVSGDPTLLKRAFGNIVDNAMHYAPPDTAVEIDARVSSDELEAVVRVRDFGHGVADEELEKIFLPYYRTDTAREPSRGGTGLGLSITKRVVQGLGGRVTAARAPSGGLIVEVRLPLQL